MNTALTVICYFLCAYGVCNLLVYGAGPFNMLAYMRLYLSRWSENLGNLFGCMMCLPTNYGLIFSLVDWFLIPGIALSPFNIILGGLGGWYWILAMLCDAGITSGVVWLIHEVDDRLGVDTMIENPDNYVDEEEKDSITTEDITRK